MPLNFLFLCSILVLFMDKHAGKLSTEPSIEYITTCVCAGGTGGSGELSAGRAEQPEGAEAAAGAAGQHCDWADVPGEPGDCKTQFNHQRSGRK